MALKSRQLLSELRARTFPKIKSLSNAEIAALSAAGQAGLSTFELDELLMRILAIAHGCFHLRNVAILRLDRKTQLLCVGSQVGWEDGKDLVCRKSGQGITAHPGGGRAGPRPWHGPGCRHGRHRSDQALE